MIAFALRMMLATISPSTPCTPQQVVTSAVVATRDADASNVGLKLLAEGLRVMEVADVSWPRCSVVLQDRVHGRSAITDGGVPIDPAGGRLITRDDKIWPPDVEPPHPDIAHATFQGSTGLGIGDQRAGLWRQADGTTLIARYRPGQPDRPIPILQSKIPLLGAFYLPAPDTRGGVLSIWQRLPAGQYRLLSVAWSEEGVR